MLACAALLGAAVNPAALARSRSFLRYLRYSPTMKTAETRMFGGDITHFPSLNVATGLIQNRRDVDEPVSRLHSVIIATATLALLIVAFLGLSRFRTRELCLAAALLVPLLISLLATRILSYPYGYSKFLALTVPLWAAVLSLILRRAAGFRSGHALRWLRPGLIGFGLSLSLISVAETTKQIRQEILQAPAFDPAYAELAALARKVPRDALLVIDSAHFEGVEWMKYFLGMNAVVTAQDSAGIVATRFRVVDLRTSAPDRRTTVVIGRTFAVEPLPASTQPPATQLDRNAI
jgi:hypothetical protein